MKRRDKYYKKIIKAKDNETKDEYQTQYKNWRNKIVS